MESIKVNLSKFIYLLREQLPDEEAGREAGLLTSLEDRFSINRHNGY